MKKLNLFDRVDSNEVSKSATKGKITIEPFSVIACGTVIDNSVILEDGCIVGNNVTFNGSVTTRDRVTFGDGVVFNGKLLVGSNNTLGDAVINAGATFAKSCCVGDLISNNSIVKVKSLELKKALTKFKLIYRHSIPIQSALRFRLVILGKDGVEKKNLSFVILVDARCYEIFPYSDIRNSKKHFGFRYYLKSNGFSDFYDVIRRDVATLICHLLDDTVQDITFPIVDSEYVLTYDSTSHLTNSATKPITVNDLVMDRFC